MDYKTGENGRASCIIKVQLPWDTCCVHMELIHFKKRKPLSIDIPGPSIEYCRQSPGDGVDLGITEKSENL